MVRLWVVGIMVPDLGSSRRESATSKVSRDVNEMCSRAL